MDLESCVIFGGTGCIGTHVAKHLLEFTATKKIYLADIRPPSGEIHVAPVERAIKEGRVVYVASDVREPIEPGGIGDIGKLPACTDLIVNLAAVHREPGHRPQEYFETNLAGAENVCNYATQSNCKRIVFTSSISPYGTGDALRDETSLPAPETPYGSSKLVAEQMHIAWRNADSSRRLVILRPGVVFGPGEHANVARLARSLLRGYFVYMGNRDTRKAGVYVKELCHVMQFAIDYQDRTQQPMLLWNVSMDPPPPVEEFVDAICKVTGAASRRPSVPRGLLVGASYPIDGIARFFGIDQPMNPVRLRKFFRSNHIDPRRLREAGYCWHYSLQEAIADWKHDAPEDFRRWKDA